MRSYAIAFRPRRARVAALLSMALVAMGMLAGAAVARAPSTPSERWVQLAGGLAGDFEWSVKVGRPPAAARAADRRPCLMVVTAAQASPYDLRRTRYKECVDATEELQGGSPPLLAVATEATHDSSTFSTVGIVAAPSVHRIEVMFNGGRRRVVRLDSPRDPALRVANLAPIRYAALTLRTPWCGERLMSIGGNGRVLWDSGDIGSC